jgi:hypothetical protein
MSGAPPGAPPGRIPGGVPTGAVGADLRFYTIADRYLDDLFAAYPCSGTVAGFHRHDDQHVLFRLRHFRLS